MAYKDAMVKAAAQNGWFSVQKSYLNAEPNDIAAVIMESVAANMGVVLPQEYFHITPDLSTFGKIIGEIVTKSY